MPFLTQFCRIPSARVTGMLGLSSSEVLTNNYVFQPRRIFDCHHASKVFKRIVFLVTAVFFELKKGIVNGICFPSCCSNEIHLTSLFSEWSHIHSAWNWETVWNLGGSGHLLNREAASLILVFFYTRRTWLWPYLVLKSILIF